MEALANHKAKTDPIWRQRMVSLTSKVYVGLKWESFSTSALHQDGMEYQLSGLINIDRVLTKCEHLTFQPLSPHNNCLDTDHKC